MTKVWYCAQCGYEDTAGGRCHQCRDRLVASPLLELEAGEEADEVGYRIEGWTDSARVWLITALIDAEVHHRFEGDELVVSADDEARVDDLIAEVATAAIVEAGDGAGGDGPTETGEGATPEDDEALERAIELLAASAEQLRKDPTDMHADAGVAEASAAVFEHETVARFDDDTWAAIGRVTRRLLSALGADEALEQEISHLAGLLVKLLRPGDTMPPGGAPPTIYEFPEWLPEQRSELSVLLDASSVPHRWIAEELLVPSEREAEVEQLFDQVAPSSGSDEDDEERYRALEELFAATGRLASAPEDEERAADFVAAADVVDGTTPLGFDDAQWWTIRNKARGLLEVIESRSHPDVVEARATELRELLRAMV
ncbi:MAG: hypothetical protein ACR2KC_05670 [Acidimicrobiales bacterium]